MSKKTIIVTGGAGYIGAQVAKILTKDYQVIVIDKKNPYTPISQVKYVRHDLRTEGNLLEIFKRADFCIHLAAEVGGVAFANKFPYKIFRNNSLIDINVIELSRKSKIKRIIYISSSLIYEKSKKFPLKEDYSNNLPPPSLSYGFEKLFGENLCRAYYQEFGLQYSICRLFNVYGKNDMGNMDPNGHVIPDLIKKVKNSNGTIEIIGKRGILRSFSHVDDVARGIIATVEKSEAANEIFNIADSKEYTLEQIVNILWNLLKKKGRPKFIYLPSYEHDVIRNYASVAKARKILNWKALKSIHVGLSEML